MSDTNESEEVSESVATFRQYSAEWPWRITPNLVWVMFDDLSDQIMNAQASFLEFARHAEYERFRILPVYENVSIKAFFPTPGRPPMFGEHMFLTNVFTDGKNVTATLNADSIRRDDLKEGQEVTFLIEMVSDWFLVHAGKGIGGFTVPHVWSQLSEDQQRAFQNEPPFAWFLHRGSKSAEEQLVELPQ
jgi:uncharacterized protein YegJ (DUF2314 family)